MAAIPNRNRHFHRQTAPKMSQTQISVQRRPDAFVGKGKVAVFGAFCPCHHAAVVEAIAGLARVPLVGEEMIAALLAKGHAVEFGRIEE